MQRKIKKIYKIDNNNYKINNNFKIDNNIYKINNNNNKIN